jgi:hypothetical protein
MYLAFEDEPEIGLYCTLCVRTRNEREGALPPPPRSTCLRVFR